MGAVLLVVLMVMEVAGGKGVVPRKLHLLLQPRKQRPQLTSHLIVCNSDNARPERTDESV